MKTAVRKGLEEGANIVTLDRIEPYVGQTFEGNDPTPVLKFVYANKDGYTNELVNLTLNDEGAAVLSPGNKLGKRVRALLGMNARDVAKAGWEIALPEGLEDWTTWPTLKEQGEEGFDPYSVDIVVGKKALVGQKCQVVIEISKDGNSNIVEVVPPPNG